MHKSVKGLTQEGIQQMDGIAAKYAISKEAVSAMLQAVINGRGRMAQFNIPELGGNGQWMQGGMTMVGDMFNYSLKATVSSLCQELSGLIGSKDLLTPGEPAVISNEQLFPGNWWPAEFGSPASSGSQNSARYAFFPPPVARLVIENHGDVVVYDTKDHRISGVSQQQGTDHSILFSSQHGLINVCDLTVVSGPGKQDKEVESQKLRVSTNNDQPGVRAIKVVNPLEHKENSYQPPVTVSQTGEDDIFIKIDKLADLFKKGILTEAEFISKKTELLQRI